jgi:hypothetical protein
VESGASQARTEPTEPLRVLFCLGVSSDFFAAAAEERKQAMEAIPPAFADLGERFGLRVLGTMDDDQLMVGPSTAWPWTAYILAEAPDLDAVVAACNVLREVEVGDSLLWRYLRIEARVGRPLFFGNA